MPFFCEEFHGWVIRIGPQAHRRPDPYVWRVLVSDDGKWLVDRDGELLIPLSDEGEFQAVSTRPLTVSAVRTAIEAAQSLGFDDSRWLHKGAITMNTHTPLHKKHGAKMGEQFDQSQVIDIAGHYLEEMKAGRMKVENVSEIHLGNGKYVRSFVIQEPAAP